MEAERPKCPDCRIPMVIVREDDNIIIYECNNCGHSETKTKKHNIYVQS